MLEALKFNHWTMVFQVINMGALTLAIIAGVYVWFNAKSTGLNYWFWAIVSIFLFLFGLIGYLLYRYFQINREE